MKIPNQSVGFGFLLFGKSEVVQGGSLPVINGDNGVIVITPYKWPYKKNGFPWGYFAPISGVSLASSHFYRIPSFIACQDSIESAKRPKNLLYFFLTGFPPLHL